MTHSQPLSFIPHDPDRSHDSWADVDALATPYSYPGSLEESGGDESGPSSYLQTPPQEILDLPSPPTEKSQQYHAEHTVPPPSLSLELHARFAQSQPHLDVLTAGVGELAQALDARQLTSVRVIKMYLHQIEKWNGYLHALTYVAARELLLAQARECDRMIRSEGFDRRAMPLCGVPVIVK